METKTRNIGIDFLRIISMMLIVIAHIFKAGGLLYSPIHNGSYYVLWTIETIAYCSSVTCYALLTGYLLVDKPFKLRRIISLWMQVLFYSVSVLLLFLLFAPEVVTANDIYSALFPMVKSNYWYYTAYFCLFFFIPFLNVIIKHLDRRGMNMLCIYIIISCSVIPSLVGYDIICENNGYSVLWLAAMYILGAYLKKYGIPKWFCTWNAALIFILSVTISCVLLHYRGVDTLSLTDPFILLSSIVLVMRALQLKWKEGIMSKFIIFLGSASFTVYIIHTHPLIWNNILINWFSSFIWLPTAWYIVAAIGISIVFIVVCSLIEELRKMLFHLVKLDRLAKWLDWLFTFRFATRKNTKNIGGSSIK